MKWNEKDVVYLKNNYNKNNKNELSFYLKRPWKNIKIKAYSLGLDNPNSKFSNWTEEELMFLKNNYETNYENFNKNFIINGLNNKTWAAIENKAYILGLKRNLKLANLSKLLNETPEAYYWLGFLMADGHFANNGSITINLSIKDIQHIQKFAEFLNIKKEFKKASLYAMDKKIVGELKNKFRISNNKTYNPCNIEKIKNKDLLFSLIIGFIDGDGCINLRGSSITITSHRNWESQIIFMGRELYGFNKTFNLGNNETLINLGIFGYTLLKKIKIKILELKLPILTRKWDRIDHNKMGKKEKSYFIKKYCFEKFENGLKPQDVIKMGKFSRNIIYVNYNIFIKERDLKRENYE